ncbi:hypothetical protein Bbelb_329030 [Branchiostoma belcheri]|nr:hypothetical protein Bbelb_329030 [Branchiostoma belcheri]
MLGFDLLFLEVRLGLVSAKCAIIGVNSLHMVPPHARLAIPGCKLRPDSYILATALAVAYVQKPASHLSKGSSGRAEVTSAIEMAWYVRDLPAKIHVISARYTGS